MRNFRGHKLRHPRVGGASEDRDDEDLARVVAGLRAARPVVPHELREEVRSLQPAEPAKSRPRLSRWIPAILATAGLVVAAPMLQISHVAPPPSPGRVLVAVDASSTTSDGQRVAQAIEDTLTAERSHLKWFGGDFELVTIGSNGVVSARLNLWSFARRPRGGDAPSTSHDTDTLRAALTRPSSRSDLRSALNAAGRQLQSGLHEGRRVLVILTDGVPADFERRQKTSRRHASMAEVVDRLGPTDVPNLRGARVRLVDVQSTSGRKPSRRAAERARLSLAWARATGASVVVH